MARRRKKKAKHNNGKPYENKVAEAIRSLYPRSEVKTDVKLPASITGGQRQIDTLLDINGTLTDFDAKDHKRNIGIDTVAAFKFKLDDERISNGVMVSNSPYASSAVNAAEHLDVRLTHLINLKDEEIPFKIAQKTLVTDHYVKALSFGLRHNSIGGNFAVHPDLGKAVLVNDNQDDRQNAYDIFKALWNEGVLKAGQVGTYRYTLPRQRIVNVDGSVSIVDEFYFDYVVGIVHRMGEWSIKQAEGLYDVKNKSFTTNKDIISEALSTEQVNEWPIVDEDEATKGGYGIKLSVVSQLPDAPPENHGPSLQQ